MEPQNLVVSTQAIATLLPTGKGTSASHLTATQDKFVEGEATIIELSGAISKIPLSNG